MFDKKPPLLVALLLLASFFVITWNAVKTDDFFDVIDVGSQQENIPLVQPWKTISLDPAYGGLWVVAGDVDDDGQVEIVSCENVNKDDVHYTSTAVVQKLDGQVVWRWGDPDVGRKIWHHDVACQVHDWDGDGTNEVILLTKGFLVELEGKTGREKRRIPIPPDASDCLVFCDLAGKGRPTDYLVKDRYHNIWAYDENGELLWHVKDPGGFRTAHQPRPIDLDGDGRDEIMAGYAMLNGDGSIRWVFQSKSVDQSRGHLDCVRVLSRGQSPEDMRLALTCCGANNIALIDGNGTVQWEISGHHFESVTIGNVNPHIPGPQILVDIDHRPVGESPLWLLDQHGRRMGQIMSDYCRHHRLIDWTGDGLDEIFVGHNRAVYNYRGERIATLAAPQSQAQGEDSILPGDFNGDGILDLLLATPETVYIFQNQKGKKSQHPVPLGTGLNVTLY